ncbi:MAG: HAD-IA family hydrolase [Candidatus Dormiibacterota bacterium]
MTAIPDSEANRLEGVLFDYGETLVRFVRPDAALAAALLRIGATLVGAGMEPPPLHTLRHEVIDRVEREVLDHQRRGELAEISVVDASRHAYAEAGLDLEDELLDEVLRIEQEAWWQGATVDPAAIRVLDALRRDGIRVGLCSNAPYRIRSLHAQLSYVGLDSHLDSVTFSAEVGWRKPSPRIFSAALQGLGTAASTTVMVGDSEAQDIAGAHEAGMRAVLLRRTGADTTTTADAVVDSLSELTVALREIGLYWA